MYLELGHGITHRGERGDDGELAAAQVETGAGIDVPERELDQVAGEVGGDIGEAFDDLFAGFTVNLAQFREPLSVAVRAWMGVWHEVSFPVAGMRSEGKPRSSGSA